MNNGKKDKENIYEVIVLEPKIYRYKAQNIKSVEKEIKNKINKENRNKIGVSVEKVLHSITVVKKDGK